MDQFGIKATLYDLIGYAVPGFIFLAGTLFLYTLKTGGLCSDQIIKELYEKSPSFSFQIVCIILSYISGLLLASLGSLTFENKWANKISSFLYKFNPREHDKKLDELFRMGNASGKDRMPMSYCMEKYPIIYDTAFVFLSIYGFSRNLLMAIILISLSYTCLFDVGWKEAVISLLVICITFHNYKRFQIYFLKQIYTSLYLPTD